MVAFGLVALGDDRRDAAARSAVTVLSHVIGVEARSDEGPGLERSQLRWFGGNNGWIARTEDAESLQHYEHVEVNSVVTQLTRGGCSPMNLQSEPKLLLPESR